MSTPSPAPLRRAASQSKGKRYLHILLDLNDLKKGGSHQLRANQEHPVLAVSSSE